MAEHAISKNKLLPKSQFGAMCLQKGRNQEPRLQLTVAIVAGLVGFGSVTIKRSLLVKVFPLVAGVVNN